MCHSIWPRPSGAPWFLVEFVLLIFSFMCMFCRSLFVLLSFGHCVVCPSIYGFSLPL
jgi:hypothetical protein